jgi:predicted phosphohydrolase
MLERAAEEEFDLILHCGDYCGGQDGYKSLQATVKMIRKVFPDKPYVSVIGNHDYWSKPCSKTGSISVSKFNNNYSNIKYCFKENNVHFLDEDGYYWDKEREVILLGTSGWYANPNPQTNDQNFLPRGLAGDTNKWLESSSYKRLYNQLDELEIIDVAELERQTLCFVSHFPVVNTGPDYKGPFEEFCWSHSISETLEKYWNIKHFFCGHAHQLHRGPRRYESGSDYYNPKYQIVEVI